MRKMSVVPTKPYGDGDSLLLDRFSEGSEWNEGSFEVPVAVNLTTEELEELVRVVLGRLSADSDDLEELLENARDARLNWETSQEQQYPG